MNWDAIGAVGEVVGAAAVVASLVYLAGQIRSSNRQSEIESLRHTWDGLNQFCDLLARSDETAALINRGRASLASLSPEERLRFDHIHLRLLNTLESWHLQVTKTSRKGEYLDVQLANISGIAAGYLGFPGTRDLWVELADYFVPIRHLVDAALSESA